MSLSKVDLHALAEQLKRPFLMEHVAQVDHFALYLYLCEGLVARHKHLTQDELFYVQRGVLALDTDWGHITLSPREFAVVPRGLTHLSGSISRAVVLLFQAQSDPEHKNGHGRVLASQESGGFPKWSVAQESERLRQPYIPLPLAQVDEMSLRLVWCQGETLWHVQPEHDEMLLVQDGHLELGTEMGPLSLGPDELTVIPRGRIHRLVAQERTLVLSLIHGAVSPEGQMGF